MTVARWVPPAWLLGAVPAWAQVAAEPVGTAGVLAEALAAAQSGLHALAAAMLAAPGEAAVILERWSAALGTGDGVRAFAYLLVMLMIAAGVEWFFWTTARPRLLGIQGRLPETGREVLSLAARGWLIRSAAALLFGAGLIAGAMMFTWPPGVQDGVVAAAVAITATRLVRALAIALLAPRAPEQRIVRVSRRQAGPVVTAVTIAAGVVAALLAAGVLVDRVEGAVALGRALWAFAAVFAVAVLALVARVAERRRVARLAAGRRRPLVSLPFAVLLWAALVTGLWLCGAGRWAATVLVVTAAAALEAVSRPMVDRVWTLAMASPESGEAGAAPADADDRAILRALALRFTRFLVGILGLAACAALWGVSLHTSSGEETMAGRLAARLLGAAAVLLVADMAWAAVRGTVDRRLERIARSGTDPETGSEARLVTLLPIIRKGSGVVIATLAVLSVLSVFGVEITPLLAGAGIVGVAVGFGAQTLVRDILSGFFYLVEDVFRIGDYIEGGTAKGTVERITLRTVALRHQNGPLHFVPYGVLGTVRNNSRDWVIDKFQIPLPIDVDSEFVRKLVKKIGQEMQAESEFAGIIVEPLKAKLYRIDPGVKVFRCKVQTPPGKQFEVRGEALKRIEAALRANGISFANPTQVVFQGTAPQPASA